MALEGLKNAYFKAEDKWYAATERIGLSGLVDRIDKAVPSFALFLFIIVALLIAGFFMLPGVMPSGAVFSFKAIDEDNAAISNVTVTVLAADGTQLASEKTGAGGETKQITLPIGKEIEIKAGKEGYQQYKKTITVSTSMLPYEITLASAEEVTYTISLKDSLGQ
ncbi:MAG: carboxypeptidase-like regulatory domain-containing protein, partial [Candidatus Diapherotrites archaeon]|nr:carboxypeptidase-like regulatory domain-containing protein [Candidatus Diapherotrites archaeon]